MPLVTDRQVRKLMEEMTKHGQIGVASMRAGMDRKTGRKYHGAGLLPSQMKRPRDWRTRADPFAEVWDEVKEMLTNAPELEAKTVFDYLNELGQEESSRPTFQEGQLRTFQRRVRRWRAQEGPPKEVFFPQAHVPGEAMQTDFTDASELGVTIGGVPFPHLLAHCCLPFSNWQCARTCGSESLLALRRGMQAALFKLGRVPEWSQTDNSTAATHRLCHAERGEPGERGFNKKYVAFVKHFGMEPRTTAVGQKEQNGDIEAANGALKRRLEQNLLLRGSRDFESVAAYEAWINGILDKANALRSEKVAVELAAMRPLQVSRLPEYEEDDFRVSKWSTIRVLHNGYSVPSRLIGETVRVRIYEGRLEVRFAGRLEFSVEKLRGRHGHRINYRHVIWTLVRKPAAFARYRYREDLFPSLVFRRACDALSEGRAGRRADLDYLRLLYLAATTLESDVEVAIKLLLDEGLLPKHDAVAALVRSDAPQTPSVSVPEVDLSVYDGLLGSAVPS